MIIYPPIQSTASEIFYRAIRWHYLTLKHIFLYVALFAIFKGLYFIALKVGVGVYVGAAIQLIALFLLVFLFSASILATDRVFKGEPLSLWAGFIATIRRVPKIYATVVLYVAGAYLAYFFGRFLLIAIGKLVDDPSAVHSAMLLISFAFVVVFLAMFCFALPLCLIEDKSIAHSFYESLYLSEKHKFGIFVLFFVGLWTSALLSPVLFFHQSSFVLHYRLGMLVDFIILGIVGPFFLNYLLLLINDSQVQVVIESMESA